MLRHVLVKDSSVTVSPLASWVGVWLGRIFHASDSDNSNQNGRPHRCEAAGFSSRRRDISVEHCRIVGQVVCELTSVTGHESSCSSVAPICVLMIIPRYLL